jgi:hypothetical protein
MLELWGIGCPKNGVFVFKYSDNEIGYEIRSNLGTFAFGIMGKKNPDGDDDPNSPIGAVGFENMRLPNLDAFEQIWQDDFYMRNSRHVYVTTQKGLNAAFSILLHRTVCRGEGESHR